MEQTQWEEMLSQLLPPNMKLEILFIGSDPGNIVETLTELNHNVIEIAANQIISNVNIDFESETFDTIICYDFMSRLSDKKKAWTEYKRVLKKEGHAVIFDTGRIAAEQAQSQGFSHCRYIDFDIMNCMSARKPIKDEQDINPQITLFKQHIQIAKKQIQLYQNWCQSIGMPYSEYTVLNLISHHPKGIRPSDISASLVIPPQTLTRILSGLQKNGFIKRTTNNQDHRSVVITITTIGAEKMKPLQAELHEIEKSALSGFQADEIANLNSLSDKLLKALETAIETENDNQK